MPCSFASRSTTGAHSTRSATTRGSLSYAKVSTFVAWSLFRNRRLSDCPSSVPTMRKVISAGRARAARSHRATRWRGSSARWARSANCNDRLSASRDRLALTSAPVLVGPRRIRPPVGLDDPRHERMAHHVGRREVRRRDALDLVQDALGLDQAGHRALRQIDLARVAGDDGLRAEADPRQEHLHLLGRRVLRLVEDDEGVVERAAAHEGERCDLERRLLEGLVDALYELMG